MEPRSTFEDIASLFLVALPRSLSSMIYHVIRHSLGLVEPPWTSAGEILNLDRHILNAASTNDICRKYVVKQDTPDIFHKALLFLDDVFIPTKYAYKDVVQPFVVAEWLNRNGVRTIRIKRSVADVAYAMLQRHWHYPALLFPQNNNLELALVRSLICAEEALDTLSGEHVQFDEIISSEKSLKHAVDSLYGDQQIHEIRYIDTQFKLARDQILSRRNTRHYKELEHLVALALSDRKRGSDFHF